MIRFGFYGRVSTEDQQDPESSRGWQLTRSRTLIEPRGGVIVAEFFDIDKSRSIPWQRRPHATALLAELKNPDRGFDAVVIGEPHRAFYGNQYGLTFPLFEHYGVPLWVPEVGGPIDPDNEAHDLVMSVFGGMSKGERNRIKIRVRTAMATQAEDRRPVPRRPAAVRLPARGRGAAPEPGQGRRRQAAARAGTPTPRPHAWSGGSSPSTSRARASRPSPKHSPATAFPARPRTTRPATGTAAASPGHGPLSRRSWPIPATPAARCGTNSARTRSCSTWTTSPSATHQAALERAR